MKNNEVECLISDSGTKYYVLKNSKLDIFNPNIINYYMDKDLTELESRKYYKNKLIHREDSPAIEWNNGDKFWYKNGLLHRLNGPAVEYSNGDKEWYQNGELHKEDGPAIENNNGHEEYYINGERISKGNFYLKKELNNTLNLNKSIKNKIKV